MNLKPGLIWKPKNNGSEGLITDVRKSLVFIKWIKNAEGVTKHNSKEEMYSIDVVKDNIKRGQASLIDPKNSSDDPNMAFRFRKEKI